MRIPIISEADFRASPPDLKTIPLWHLNGTLTTDEIRSQLTAARNESGFGGVALLPVTDTDPAYLSEAYFARYEEILDTCQELGMQVVFYDDIGFPSGTAGGRLKARFPHYVASRLDKLDVIVTSPGSQDIQLPAGDFMGAVAMNMETLARYDISTSVHDGMLSWDVPTGTWRLMLFTCTRHGEHVDYLNPDAVDAFISLTYEAHYKRFKKHFGSTIIMSFFDDISLRKLDHRNWTPDFNRKFKARHGVDPVCLYPALWYDIGPETTSARVALFDFRAELLAEGYPRKVNEWCGKHGIGCTGHAMAAYYPQPTFMAGDNITFYRHCDIPMVDSVHYYGQGRPGFKLTSSAACSYDRPLTAVEIYGNYRTPFQKQMLYRSGMELFVRGGNLLMPHGMWYNPEAVRIEPLISHFSAEIGPELDAFNRWAARCSLMLQGGRHVADIGVLYPVPTMQAYASLHKPREGNPGLIMPASTDLLAISDLLTGDIRRDFTFLHPEVIDQRCRSVGSEFWLDNTINAEQYRVIVLPSARVIHWSNLKKIKRFFDQGGIIIATTSLPMQSAESGDDQDVQKLIAEMFDTAVQRDKGYAKKTNAAGGRSYFVLSPITGGLRAALDDALPVADVSFGNNVPPFTHVPPPTQFPKADGRYSGMLSYLHKIKDSRHLYYLANSSDARIDSTVTLRGQHRIEIWNPNGGNIMAARCKQTDINQTPCTELELTLEPVTSLFLVSSSQG